MTVPPTPPSDVTSHPSPKPARHTLRNVLLILLGILIVIFLAIQFIPVNRTNPPATTQIQWDSPQTKALAERACMDCHSNETNWRWYSHIAPASWLVYYDTMRGRSALNFSTFDPSSPPRPLDRSSQQTDLAYRLGQILAGGGGEGERGREGRFRPEGAGEATGGGQFPLGEFGQPPQNGQFQAGNFTGFLANRLKEAIDNGNMPPLKYVLLHPSARLSNAERQQLLTGLLKTFGLSQN